MSSTMHGQTLIKYSWVALFRRLRQQHPSKHPQIFTQRRSATTQKTQTFSNTALRTSNVAEVAWLYFTINNNCFTSKALQKVHSRGRMACSDMTMLIQPKTTSTWLSSRWGIQKNKTTYGLKFCRNVSLYIHLILKAYSQNCEKRLSASSRLFIRPPARNNSAPTGSTFTKFDLNIFRKSVYRVTISLKTVKNNGYITKDQYIFIIISRSVLLRMRNVSDKTCREKNQNTFCVK